MIRSANTFNETAHSCRLRSHRLTSWWEGCRLQLLKMTSGGQTRTFGLRATLNVNHGRVRAAKRRRISARKQLRSRGRRLLRRWLGLRHLLQPFVPARFILVRFKGACSFLEFVGLLFGDSSSSSPAIKGLRGGSAIDETPLERLGSKRAFVDLPGWQALADPLIFASSALRPTDSFQCR